MMKIHTLPMGPVQANCYVVIDEHSGEAAVIDPGDYTDELKSVLRDEVKNLKYILLTHGHYDHILGVAHIKDDYPDAKIAIHPYDSPCLKCEDISLATHVDHGIQKYVDYDLLAEEGFGSEDRGYHSPYYSYPRPHSAACAISKRPRRVMFSGDTLFAALSAEPTSRRGLARLWSKASNALPPSTANIPSTPDITAPQRSPRSGSETDI